VQERQEECEAQAGKVAGTLHAARWPRVEKWREMILLRTAAFVAVTAISRGKTVEPAAVIAELLLPAVEAAAGDEIREVVELGLLRAGYHKNDEEYGTLGAQADRLHAACADAAQRLAASVHAHLSRLRAPDDEKREAAAIAAAASRKQSDARHEAMEVEKRAAKRAAAEARRAAAEGRRAAAEAKRAAAEARRAASAAELSAANKKAADEVAAMSAPPLTPELGELWERSVGRQMPLKARALLRRLIATGAVGERLSSIIPFSVNGFLWGCSLKGLREMLPPGLASAAGKGAGNAATMNVKRQATTVFRGLLILVSAFTQPAALVETVEKTLLAANPTAQYKRLGGRTGCPGDQANAAPFVASAALKALKGLRALGEEFRPLALLAALLAKERDLPTIPTEAPASPAAFKAAEAALEAVSNAFLKAGEREPPLRWPRLLPPSAGTRS